MSGQLTNIADFRFDSLRKYMQSIYFTLNRHVGDSNEEKQRILRELIPQFFRRIRIYRQMPLEQIAMQSNIPCGDLIRFEGGELTTSIEIELAYCRVCQASHEREFFADRLHEFMHPSVRESKEAIAMDALRRYGVVMPDIDYASLGAPRGVVLSFSAKK